jgi:Leucine Rich repeat
MRGGGGRKKKNGTTVVRGQQQQGGGSGGGTISVDSSSSAASSRGGADGPPAASRNWVHHFATAAAAAAAAAATPSSPSAVTVHAATPPSSVPPARANHQNHHQPKALSRQSDRVVPSEPPDSESDDDDDSSLDSSSSSSSSRSSESGPPRGGGRNSHRQRDGANRRGAAREDDAHQDDGDSEEESDDSYSDDGTYDEHDETTTELEEEEEEEDDDADETWGDFTSTDDDDEESERRNGAKNHRPRESGISTISTIKNSSMMAARDPTKRKTKHGARKREEPESNLGKQKSNKTTKNKTRTGQPEKTTTKRVGGVDSSGSEDAAAYDTVARLVSNEPTLTDVTIEERSITGPAIARHMAKGLRQTEHLQRVTLVFLPSSSSSSSSVGNNGNSRGNTGEEEGTNAKQDPENEDAQKQHQRDRDRRSFLEILLLEGLERNRSVTSLIVQNATLTCSSTASLLGEAISGHSRLVRLGLKDCTVAGRGTGTGASTTNGLAVLWIALQHAKSLRLVEMRGCDLGTGSAVDVVSAGLPYMKLTALHLQHANLTTTTTATSHPAAATPTGLGFLMENVLRSDTLTELDLTGNKLGPAGVQCLASCLADTTVQKIERVILASCGIDDAASIRALTKALGRNQVLHAIDLGDNRFGDAGAKRLVSLLESNRTIKTLNIAGCQVGPELSKLLADKLRYNNSILKSFGFSSDMSLAILNSVDMVENFSANVLRGGGVVANNSKTISPAK